MPMPMASARAEVFVGSQTFLDAGVPIGVLLDGVLAAFREAGEEWGIDAQLICTAQRHRAESTAMELLDLIEPWREQVIGIGMGSAERGNPPSKFARFFARRSAAATGLRFTPARTPPPRTSSKRWSSVWTASTTV